MDPEEEHEEHGEELDDAEDDISELIIDQSVIPKTVKVNPLDKKDKRSLFPRIRNKFNENTPVYESDGCVFVNPNTFDRLVLVFECIQKKTKTLEHFTASVTINQDGSTTVDTWEMSNVRQYILVTVDGLPHKMAIDVIKNCFQCKECDKKLTSFVDVNHHIEKYKHRTYFKRFANILLNIGGLHLHMNMLRSFVSLSWNVDHSFLCNAIGFKSPKAQIFQQKVQDLHKCMDTYNARRTAKLREYTRVYVLWCNTNNIDATDKGFESWFKTTVKDESFKVNYIYFLKTFFTHYLSIFSSMLKLIRCLVLPCGSAMPVSGQITGACTEQQSKYSLGCFISMGIHFIQSLMFTMSIFSPC